MLTICSRGEASGLKSTTVLLHECETKAHEHVANQIRPQRHPPSFNHVAEKAHHSLRAALEAQHAPLRHGVVCGALQIDNKRVGEAQ